MNTCCHGVLTALPKYIQWLIIVVLSHIFVTRNYIHVVFQNLVTFHVTVYVRAKSMSVVMMQSLQQGVGFRIYIYIYK